MLQMQASFHLLAIPRIEKFAPATPSVYKSLEEEEYLNPEPFVHKDYRSLDNVNRTNIDAAISDLKLLPIIENCGLAGVMRWKPAVVNTNGISALPAFIDIVAG